MRSIYPSLVELAALVDARLGAFLDARARSVPEAAGLIGEIRRVLMAGGKRLRPAFCYWGFRATGAGHTDGIVEAASAFELLHTFAIVHDDIMDSATERRGQPATVVSLGPERALLVGDLALVLADDAFWGAELPPEALTAGFEHFTLMREQVIAGQYMDIEAHGQTIDESHARAIAVLKSGSYSVEHPLLIGARLAGGNESLLDALSRFGRPLGEAFQLRDDLLGVFGDPGTTGKPVDSDIREGKRNVLFAKALAMSSEEDRALLLARWGTGSDLSDDAVAELRAVLERSGARAATESLIDALTAEATVALESVQIPAPVRIELERLTDAAVTRTY
jgi:geranylgeranyl diphosphate synthase type I